MSSSQNEYPWLQSYPKSVPQTIDPGKYKSIVELFEESFKKFREKNSFYNMGKFISFHDLDRLSGQFASFLQHELNLKKGDRIAIQLPNILQFPVVLFGALRAGLTVVNTNPLYTAREMTHQFNDSGAKAIVILANYANLLESILSEVPSLEHVVVTEIGDLLGFPKSLIVNSVIKYKKKMVPSFNLPKAYKFNSALEIGAKKPFAEVKLTSEDLAFLQYTGGTTGVSKGAMLTHGNICSNVLMIKSWMIPLLEEGKEIALAPLPMYHIFSLTANCLTFLVYGAMNVLITNPRDMKSFIKDMKKFPFTLMTGVNTLFNGLMNHPDFSTIDFSKVRVSVAGGMALQKAVAERWKVTTKSLIVEGYGLTETSPVACINPVDGKDKVGYIGLPLPSTLVKLIDEDENEVPLGQAGEIAIQGPQVMKGYWNNPAETSKVMTKDGFLKTGDIGIMDLQGFIKIVDRKKDMILVSGFNVYPNEVENVIAKHPGVLEVAAVGVPDSKSGEAVKVFIVKKDPSLTAEDIITFSRHELTGYKMPRFVEFREDLPKTNVGKILRRALRETQ